MTMFFFEREPVWRQHMEELGIQKVVDNLKRKGLPCEWPTEVVNPENVFALKAKVTAGCYKSNCPHYEGYWLHGGAGSVECAAAGELLPGVVWYETCSKRHEECPFYKPKMENFLNTI